MVDLYTVDNPLRYQNIMEARIQDNYPMRAYNPQVEENNDGNRMFGFGNVLDPALIDDDEDSDEAHKSV